MIDSTKFELSLLSRPFLLVSLGQGANRPKGRRHSLSTVQFATQAGDIPSNGGLRRCNYTRTPSSRWNRNDEC